MYKERRKTTEERMVGGAGWGVSDAGILFYLVNSSASFSASWFGDLLPVCLLLISGGDNAEPGLSSESNGNCSEQNLLRNQENLGVQGPGRL